MRSSPPGCEPTPHIDQDTTPGEQSAGVVYLLHFDTPIGNLANPRAQARHYLGYAQDLSARLATHRRGGSGAAALLRALAQRGVGWQLVRVWPGDRELERRLKRRKDGPSLCPICRARRGLPGGQHDLGLFEDEQ
jgi:hypothetical protein